jgi:D-alanyl-D-alanine carboxypeptidase (penicillin-binding protein 5/6)
MVNKFKLLNRVLAICLVVILVLETFLYLRPLPNIQPALSVKSPQQFMPAPVPWPVYGQAALGAVGFGVLQSNGQQKPAPIASVAKVMTAYSVLKAKPIAKGQQGPTITITDQDVVVYNDYYSKGGSVTRVAVGEQISQYQALQALLLPSANNIADLLANWAFGSMDKYIIYANKQAEQLGMKNTHISDASGFSPQTMSSAQDLVLLGQAAIENPIITDIVSQQQATLPVAGMVRNVNWLLGTDSVVGIKTGDTEEAGGCYLFSTLRKVDGQDITVIGAVMGAPSLNTAITDSRPLITASDKDFKFVTAVKAGQVVGYYKPPWASGKVTALAKKDVKMLVWQDQKISIVAKLNPVSAPQAKNAVVGSITAKSDHKSAASEVILSQEIAKPSWKWRTFER